MWHILHARQSSTTRFFFSQYTDCQSEASSFSLPDRGLTLRCRHFMNQIEPIKNNSIRLCGALTADINWFDFAYAISLRIFFSLMTLSAFLGSLFVYFVHCVFTLKFCINNFARQYKTHTNTHNHKLPYTV